MDCLEGDNRCALRLFQVLGCDLLCIAIVCVEVLCVAAYIGGLCTTYPAERELHQGSQMADIQRFSNEFQSASKDGLDASVRSFGEMNKAFQAVAATVIDYSKKIIRRRHARHPAVGWRKVIRAGLGNSVSVRQESL